jgi:hypothetical protein
MRAIALRSFTLWHWVTLGLAALMVGLAVALIVVVRFVFSGFHEEYLARINADMTMPARMVADEQWLMGLLLVFAGLIVAQSILMVFTMLRSAKWKGVS